METRKLMQKARSDPIPSRGSVQRLPSSGLAVSGSGTCLGRMSVWVPMTGAASQARQPLTTVLIENV